MSARRDTRAETGQCEMPLLLPGIIIHILYYYTGFSGVVFH